MSLHFTVSLCLMAALGGGCIFSPHKDDDPPPPKVIVYPKLDSPKNAVLFLTVAWSNRDSVMIDSVYADDYTGNSIDLTDDTPEPLPFTKSDEVRAVQQMAESQSIVAVSMDFGVPFGWQEGHYSGDPADWVYVQIPSANIYLNDSVQGEYRAQYPEVGNTWIFEFKVKPVSNGTADPVWKIVEWKEERATN